MFAPLRIALALLCLVSSASCANSERKGVSPGGRAMAEGWRLDKRKVSAPKPILGKREILIDVAHAMSVLEEAYAAREVVPETDLLLARFAIRSLARSRGRWDAATMCERLDGALALLPDDQFSASIDGQPCSPARRERLAEPAAVGANVAARTESAWAVTSVEGGGGPFPVLSITHFAPPASAAWAGFKEQLTELKKNSAALILDVRGNSGGHESSAEAAAALLFGTDRPPPASGPIARSRTLASLAALMNSYWLRARAPQPDLAAAREFANYRNAYLRARSKPDSAWETEAPRGPDRPGENAYAGRLFVLADRACAGACERFLMRIKRMKNVRLIGEPTAGTGRLMDIGLVRLPQSGIEIRVPTSVLLTEGGTFPDREAVPVDISVPPGMDALTVARENLSQAAPKKPWAGMGVFVVEKSSNLHFALPKLSARSR